MFCVIRMTEKWNKLNLDVLDTTSIFVYLYFHFSLLKFTFNLYTTRNTKMSIPNLTNNIIQPQNIVINHTVPLSHAIMTNVNANNGLPIATALSNPPPVVNQSGEIKTGVMMDSLPITGAMGVQSVPVQAANSQKVVHNSTASNVATPSEPLQQVLSKTRMSDLVRDIDPNIYMEDEVEEILLSYVDDFVDRVLNGASMIAKHRHVNNIEVKDVQQFINRNFNMWAPGLGTDELRPYKRKSLVTESHKQRLALIRNALKKY